MKPIIYPSFEQLGYFAVEFSRRKIEKWIASNRKSMQGNLYLVKDRDPCTRSCPTWNQVLLSLLFRFNVPSRDSRPSSTLIPDKEIKWIKRRTVAVSTLWFLQIANNNLWHHACWTWIMTWTRSFQNETRLQSLELKHEQGKFIS